MTMHEQAGAKAVNRTSAGGGMSRRVRAGLAGAATLALLAGGVGVLLGQGEAGKGKQAASAPAQRGQSSDIAVARVQSFEVTTTAMGELQARNQVELRSQLEQQSTIQFIIPEGTRVKQGDLLVQLNTDEIQNQIDQETPRLASARADLVAAENQYQIQINDNASNLRKAELDLQLAELELRQWRDGDAVKRRQEAQLSLETATLELERLAQKLIRSQELLSEGFLSKDEADQDEVAYIRAISEFQTARLQLEVFERYEFAKEDKVRQSDVDEALAEVERVRLNNEIQLASREAERANGLEQVKLLENRLNKLKQNLAAGKITAPNDGLVVYASSIESSRWGGGGDQALQIGQQIYPNQLIIALPDTSEMIASIRVQESLAGRLRPGMPVYARVDAAGGAGFEGTVESIGVMAESGGWRDPNLREYTVRVKLSDVGDAELKPAMRVEARIILDRVSEALTVPVQAVFMEGPVQFVYVPQGDRFVRRPVRLGRRSETLAEIASGLTEGTSVLLREPRAGEVITRAWDSQELADAGYRLDENGQVVPAPRGRPGGGPPGGAGAGRAARGAQPGAGTTQASDASGAPASTSAPAATPTAAPAQGESTSTTGTGAARPT